MPRKAMRPYEEERAKFEADQIEAVEREVHAEAVKSRDLPIYADPAYSDYDDVTMQVTFPISGWKVAEILQAQISLDRIGAVDDARINEIVHQHFRDMASQPVEVDLSPYHDRVRNMTRGGAVLPPVAQTWGTQTTGEQQ